MRNVAFGCGKENSADILYQKVLRYSLLFRHNKIIVLEVLQNTYISKETF